MEEEAPAKRSVAELAGKFKTSVPPPTATGNEQAKPVRRRPPCSLQLPKTQADEQKPPGIISPFPSKAKRNSALIEKLQANLVLSPSALLPSPKSPGLRLLPPSFAPPSPGTPSSPVTMVTPTSPVSVATSSWTKEEGPASFEAPPTATDGSILPSINKGRARHSIRRRPPSRRHRKCSSGDEVGVATGEKDTPLSSPSDPEAKTTDGREEKDGDVFNKEVKTEEEKKEETETDAFMSPEEQTEIKTEGQEPQEPAGKTLREEEKNQKEGEKGSMGEEDSPARTREEEKNQKEGEKGSMGEEDSPARTREEELEEASAEDREGETGIDSKEEDRRKEASCQSSGLALQPGQRKGGGAC